MAERPFNYTIRVCNCSDWLSIILLSQAPHYPTLSPRPPSPNESISDWSYFVIFFSFFLKRKTFIFQSVVVQHRNSMTPVIQKGEVEQRDRCLHVQTTYKQSWPLKDIHVLLYQLPSLYWTVTLLHVLHNMG